MATAMYSGGVETVRITGQSQNRGYGALGDGQLSEHSIVEV